MPFQTCGTEDSRTPDLGPKQSITERRPDLSQVPTASVGKFETRHRVRLESGPGGLLWGRGGEGTLKQPTAGVKGMS